MMKLYAPWEKAFDKVYTPFEQFIHAQTTSGLILVTVTIFALLLANSPFAETYAAFFQTKLTLSIGDLTISHTLKHWINDALMAIFFFMVGLEIKREVLIGELSDFKAAILPIFAAIGGMVVPAAIYLFINSGDVGVNGWGIPMATDIAFAISALVLLQHRVSPALVTFLVALAIVDDLGAVVVIAIFYTETINMMFLGLTFGMLALMIAMNRFGIRSILPYFLTGIIMWFFMLESGVHATIAGVLAAMAIPSKPRIPPIHFTNHTKNLLDEYDNYPVATDHNMHQRQRALLQKVKDRVDEVSSPALRLEHELHLPVALLIIPIFALANAGIAIEANSFFNALYSKISLGVILGLVVGKVLGIAGVSYIALKMGLAKLPDGTTLSQVLGVAFLGGIGFTMSIFVAELAFAGTEQMIFQAKVGILVASLFSGLFGYIWLKYFSSNKAS